MHFYYCSRNYKNLSEAGNKAKTDIEYIMKHHLKGENAGVSRTQISNVFIGFIVNLAGIVRLVFTLKPHSILILQYPLNKYYVFVCKYAWFRKSKVVTVIHDILALRKQKDSIPVGKEIKQLEHSTYLIVHNESMKTWLQQKGYTKQMLCLEIFDFLSDIKASEIPPPKPYRIIYAGSLIYNKVKFLYKMDTQIDGWKLSLYGNGFNPDRLKNKEHFIYNGFVPSEELIKSANGHFGLVWDGHSTAACTGNFGEYIRYNNPHKVSLYLRCHLPVIIWQEAALAPFIKQHHLGLCIHSLEQLNTLMANMTDEEYQVMKTNTISMSNKLASGYFFKKVIEEAFMTINQTKFTTF